MLVTSVSDTLLEGDRASGRWRQSAGRTHERWVPRADALSIDDPFSADVNELDQFRSDFNTNVVVVRVRCSFDA
ncbi:hypothetical protein ACFQ0O_23215 [Saccharopolyspora spinosporotrichia]